MALHILSLSANCRYGGGGGGGSQGKGERRKGDGAEIKRGGQEGGCLCGKRGGTGEGDDRRRV